MKFELPKLPFKLPKMGLVLDVESKLTLAIIGSFAMSLLLFLTILEKAGSFGLVVGALLFQLFGRLVMLIPVAFIWISFMLLKIQKNHDLVKDINSRLIWGIIFFFGSIAGFLNLIFKVEDIGQIVNGGGLFGYIFYPFGLGFFGPFGGFVVLLAIWVFGFFLISQMTIVKFIDNVQITLKNPSKFWDFVPDIFETWHLGGKPNVEAASVDTFKKDQEDEEKLMEKEFLQKAIHPKVFDIATNTPVNDQPNGFVLLDDNYVDQPSVTTIPLKTQRLPWKLPNNSILKENFTKPDPGNVEGNKKKIKETLEHFGIGVEMADVVTGPTVSQYTLRPARGVKLSSIDAVQRDLALALAASSLRLEAPIPGKSLVGIEIPNEIKAVVRVGSMLHSKEFLNFKDALPVAIGEDVSGKKIIFSIAKMPHLLVTGTTGSGKSIWINSMLLSLLFKYNPTELQLILIDMKIVELKLYEGIPHLLSPVITDGEKAINALKWAVAEMGKRYQKLEVYGKRNIADYNEFVSESRIAKEAGEVKMPYLVLVIDELGDLMVIAKNEVEPIVVRLTQMSRAVGIHLVLGTQRPDTHVVTGLIKANIPSRIAFAVASQIDSRVILDQGGAEKLLGQGDGLFMSPSTIKPVRFQGCFVEELEVRKCVSYWRDQKMQFGNTGNFNEEVTQILKTKIVVPGLIEEDDDEGDNLYDKIKKFVIAQQSASTSMLQTAFGIGYPKARKFMDMLENEGVVGPSNGSKAREVYVQM
jgi:S-DNA-T family DNA segregation ATPase FtsK/SpoIIIE